MISVRNHLQLLNGNKLYFLIFSCLLIFASCNTSKKTSKSNSRSNNRTTTSKSNNSKSNKEVKLDTIQWTDISPKDPKKIQTNNNNVEVTSEIKDGYKLVLFLPFGGSSASDNELLDEGYNENRFANYYGGVKMAMDDLERKNAKLNVYVVDSESGYFSSKLEAHRDADIIIGPYDRDQLKLAAQFGKQNKITVISPWQSSSKIASQNPYYVQLKPNIKSYMKALVDHALKNYSPDQLFVLGRENNGSDKKMMDYIKRYAAAKSGTQINDFYVNPDSLLNGETAYDSIFYSYDRSAFILPNYSFKSDESFIYSAVRKLGSEKGFTDVKLYGMPILLDSDRIEFSHYRSLQMRVARSEWVDRKAPNIKSFRKRYFDLYSALPTDDAYEGYDMMTFVGENLARYGTAFQFKMQGRSQQLQANYQIEKVFDSKNDAMKDIQQFENMNIDIIGFERNQFRKL